MLASRRPQRRRSYEPHRPRAAARRHRQCTPTPIRRCSTGPSMTPTSRSRPSTSVCAGRAQGSRPGDHGPGLPRQQDLSRDGRVRRHRAQPLGWGHQPARRPGRPPVRRENPCSCPPTTPSRHTDYSGPRTIRNGRIQKQLPAMGSPCSMSQAHDARGGSRMMRLVADADSVSGDRPLGIAEIRAARRGYRNGVANLLVTHANSGALPPRARRST